MNKSIEALRNSCRLQNSFDVFRESQQPPSMTNLDVTFVLLIPQSVFGKQTKDKKIMNCGGKVEFA